MHATTLRRRGFFWLLLLAITAGLIAAAGFYVTPLVLAAEDEADDDDTPDVVFVPTPHDVVAKMLEVAKVKKGDVVFDLGCGDGRIVATASKKFGCKGTGFDINPVRIKESLGTVDKFNVNHLVSIEKKNIFSVDLSEASVITLYLLPELNARLIPQLEKMKPGSRIVSHEYAMQDKAKPDETIRMTSREDNTEHVIYLWTIPLKTGEEKKSDEKKEKEKE
jgi:hypothetical protein